MFLEGNGLLRGWATLVEKLWALGVVTRAEAKTEVVPVAGKAKKSFGNRWSVRRRHLWMLPKCLLEGWEFFFGYNLEVDN